VVATKTFTAGRFALSKEVGIGGRTSVDLIA